MLDADMTPCLSIVRSLTKHDVVCDIASGMSVTSFSQTRKVDDPTKSQWASPGMDCRGLGYMDVNPAVTGTVSHFG